MVQKWNTQMDDIHNTLYTSKYVCTRAYTALDELNGGAYGLCLARVGQSFSWFTLTTHRQAQLMSLGSTVL